MGSLSRTVSGGKSDGQLRSVVRIELVAEWNSQCLSYSDSQFYKLLLINKCVLIKPVFHYIMDLGPSDQRQTAQGLNMATQEIGVETVRDTVRSTHGKIKTVEACRLIPEHHGHVYGPGTDIPQIILD